MLWIGFTVVGGWSGFDDWRLEGLKFWVCMKLLICWIGDVCVVLFVREVCCDERKWFAVDFIGRQEVLLDERGLTI